MGALAERGQRLVEEPPFGLDQLGLEPYLIQNYGFIFGLMQSLRQTLYLVT